MRVLLISQTGFGFGIGTHLTNEGHQVITCLNNVPSLQQLISDNIPDTAIVDEDALQVPAEWLRTRGIRVLGASPWAGMLQSNPSYKTSIISAVGYKTDANATGTDAGIVGWFNGQRFISKSLVFNYTKFMPGDIGIDVESSGFVAYFDVDKSKLVNDILNPLERFLRKANHRGPFSIEVVITDKGEVFVKDISAEICKPYTQAIYENTRKSKSDVLLSVINEASEAIPYIEPVVCGVLLSKFPYPASVSADISEVSGINPFNLKHMWAMDLNKEGDIWTSGKFNGCLGYVLAHGKDVQEASRRAYRTISNINVEGIQYRNDIGKDVNEKIYKLKKLNLI